MSESNLPLSSQVQRYAQEIGRGELSALGYLFDLTSGRLLRYAYLITKNQTDAEDALQAAWLRVSRRPQILSKARMPWAYFIRIVRNEALKILGRRRTINSTNPIEVATTSEVDSDREEIVRRVRNAINQLPQEQAEVINLKIWEEMTFAEVAQVLGESPNTVASRYRYAISKLERTLESLGGEVSK